MTIPSAINKSGPYTGNGVTTVFPYGFRILDASHIKVVRTEGGVDTILTTGFTVSGIGNGSGGNVTFTVAPMSAQKITLIRNVPFTQSTDLENQGAYYAETIEDALDLAVMRDQQLQEQVDRSLKVSVGALPSELDDLAVAVRTVSDNIQDVRDVAEDIENVNVVATNAASVNAVAGGIANVNAVAASIANVNTVGANISSVVTVRTNIGAVQTVASNVNDVTWMADVYYGPSATDPLARRDSSPLQAGDFYFNTATDMIRVWDGLAWRSQVKAAGISTYRYVATSGQAVFTGADANSNVLFTEAGALLVTLNGVALIEGDDFTVTDGGDSITLATGAALSDDLVILSFDQLDFTDTIQEMIDLRDETAALAGVLGSFATRAAFVAAAGSPPWPSLANGQVVTAGGLQYRRQTGATWIADLPGWVPNGRVTPKHFGAIGGADLVAKTGPDDSAAFAAMLAYCHSNKINPLIDDYHNLLSAPFQTEGVRLDGIVMEGTGRGNCGIRVRIGDPNPQLSGTYSQAGTNTITVTIADHGMTTGDYIYLNFTSGSGDDDTWAVDGWFYITVTPAPNTFTVTSPYVRTNSGNCERYAFPEYCGAVILEGVGAGVRDMEIMAHQFTQRGADRGHLGANILTGDFIYGLTGPEAMGFVVDSVRLTRAASTVGDESFSGAAIANMGNSHSSAGEIRAEIDGTVGVGFSYAQLAHWGCSGTDPRANPGETYHPHSIRFSPIGKVKGATYGIAWASCYDMDCPSLAMDGGRQAFVHLPGDNADAFAIARDAGKICQGLRIGAISATLDAARENEGDSGISINCQAGSKWEVSPAGDGGDLLRQVPTDLTIGSISIHYDGACPANTDAINLAHISGAIRLGQITAKGYSRRALSASGGGNSYLSYNVVNADQNIYLNNIDKVDADGNAVEVGYSDETGALTFLGTELTATLGATVAANATSCTLSAGISDIVYPGNTIMVGTDEVIATAVTPAGGTTLYHTPVLAGASSGATVTVEQRMKVRAQPDVRGGRYGVRVQRTEAMFWGKGPVNTGQHGYQIETGAVVTLQGAWPQATGENAATATNYDMRILAGGHCEVYGANIGPGAATLEHHILVEAGGSLVGPNGVYRGSRPIISAAFDSYTPGRLVDAAGARVLPIPDKGEWTPALNIGGSTTGITYSFRQGHYVVEGRTARCSFDFTLSSKGALTGSLTLTGLPFAQDNDHDAFSNIGITLGNLVSDSISLRFQAGTATFQRQSLTNINNMTDAEIGNSSRFIGELIYTRAV